MQICRQEVQIANRNENYSSSLVINEMQIKTIKILLVSLNKLAQMKNNHDNILCGEKVVG